MAHQAQTPKKIQEHKDHWLWVQAYQRMHTRRQQFNMLFIGQCGKGKSYASLNAAELMDMNEGGEETRFNIDKVAFSAHDFARLTNSNFKIGNVIILDDAALAIYSKDAMTKAVKHISKIFISQRHLRRCVFLSTPSRDMLAKNVLQTLLTISNMMRIIEKDQVSIGRPYYTQLNPLSGKLYFKKFIYSQKKEHAIHNVMIKQKEVRPDLTFNLPSRELVRDYEKIRKETTAEHYEEAEKQTAKKEEKKKRTVLDDYNFVKGNIEQFLDKVGKVDPGRLMLAGIAENRSRALSKTLNDEINAEGEAIHT